MRKTQLFSIVLACAYLLNACGGVGGSTTGGGGGGGGTQPLGITSGAPPNGTVQSAYGAAGAGFSFGASGGVSPYSWNWTASSGSSLPPGLGLSAAGLISGTPTTAGTYNVTVTVQDSASPPSQKSANYPIVIAAPVSSLAITSTTPPNGTVGQKYDLHCLQIPPCNVFVGGFPLAATGGVQPYSWAASGLPPGLTLVTSNGSPCLNVSAPAICGTPTMAGSYNVTLTVKDSESPAAQASATYAIAIKGAITNAIPYLNQPLNPDAAPANGAGFTLTVKGTGFVPGSIVNWNGSPRATTFANESELTAAIPASDISVANTASVTVVNPAPGGGSSNVLYFEATQPSSWVALGAPAQVTVGNGPFSFAIGDFNGDGKLDLAVVNTNFNNGSVFLGNGNGTFQQAANFNLGSSSPSSVAVGDFNGDGKPDLAVANNGSNNVSILLGNGDGTFQPAQNFNADQNPISLAVGDFNGDGALDLATTNYASNDVSVLLGNGDGTFQPAVSYSVGQNPVSIAVGDFNGDGNLDLVVTNNSSGTVSVLFGIGNGAFLPATNFSAGQNPGSVVVGDFNGDGNLDLALADTIGNSINVLLGNGDGTFQTPVSYSAGFEPSLALGDLNGDGKLDLAIADVGSGDVTVLLGNGDGTFQPTVSYLLPQGANGVALGDFNGRGKFDFAVISNSSALSILSQTVPLSGPNATLSSTNIDFECRNANNAGCQCVTSSSLTLSNFGSQTLNISGRTISGPFSAANYCGTSLESGRSCTIDVTWLQEDGAGTGLLSIADNAPGSPQEASLSAIEECTPTMAARTASEATSVCQKSERDPDLWWKNKSMVDLERSRAAAPLD